MRLGLNVDVLKTAQDGQSAVIQSWTSDMTGYVADVNKDKKYMINMIEDLTAAVTTSGSRGFVTTNNTF